jgi:hypothetical protein
MSKLQCFALGSLGGLLPVLASLVTVDLAPIIDQANALTIGNYVGFGIRVVGLLLLGGIMAALNREVQQPLALVQLGIAAPALVTSYINSADPVRRPPSRNATEVISFIGSANANELAAYKNIQVAGFFSDVAKAVVNPLREINRIRRGIDVNSPPDMAGKTYPPSPAPAPRAVGRFCSTLQGRFGPGPEDIVGNPCTVPSDSGSLQGIVTE